MNTIGIDCMSLGVNKLIRRLEKLKKVFTVTNCGKYRQDESYSQLRIETLMTEDDVDTWLYRFSPIDYVGTFTVEG